MIRGTDDPVGRFVEPDGLNSTERARAHGLPEAFHVVRVIGTVNGPLTPLDAPKLIGWRELDRFWPVPSDVPLGGIRDDRSLSPTMLPARV